MTYCPVPIDTTAVALDDMEQRLVEKLARNTHDVWAQQRLNDGWRYGVERDDLAKTHPCLVAYDQLPEQEKEYDRRVSGEVVKTLLKMGYSLQPPVADEGDSEVAELLLSQMDRPDAGSLTLLRLWQYHDEQTWRCRPQLYLTLGSQFLKLGEALSACDVFSTGLEVVNDLALLSDDPSQRQLHIRLRQQRALALIQSGAYPQARRELQALASQVGEDGEICGLLGRTWKDAAALQSTPEGRNRHWTQAFDCYAHGFELALKAGAVAQAYYTGINAATLALWCGDQSASHRLAEQVRTLCLQHLHTADSSQRVSFWLLSTLGEAELLLGDGDAAQQWYQQAVDCMGADLRSQASMYDQARQIVRHSTLDVTWLEELLAPSSVAVFCGHRLDLPQQRKARFPLESELVVRQRIADLLDELQVGIGYASAASGADLLFLEEMLRRGGNVIVVLPFEVEHFIRTSVEEAGADWCRRFEAVLARADEVRILGRYDVHAANGLYDFTNHYLLGAAQVHSCTIRTELHALTVWNGDESGGLGGTASAVALWRQTQPLWRIDPVTADCRRLDQCRVSVDRPLPSPGPEETIQHHSHLYMLFADVKGYSRLSEAQTALFSQYFLAHISRILARFDDGILTRRTQGDSLFLMFDRLETALELARTLRDETADVDWTCYQLPADLSYRIALDAGPCFSYQDPISHHKDYCGHYVVRAARLEPVTPAGHVFASETFVALARMKGIAATVFQYAGQITLPKDYGFVQAFHVE